MRFTLVKMFVAVTMVALACAGLLYRTSFWASIVVTLTIALYAIVAIRAFGCSGVKRASALSFSFAGVAYLLLATCSVFTGIREMLLTNYPIAFAAQRAMASNPMAFPDQLWTSYPTIPLPQYVNLNGSSMPVSPSITPTTAPAEDGTLQLDDTPPDSNSPLPPIVEESVDVIVAGDDGMAPLTPLPTFPATSAPGVSPYLALNRQVPQPASWIAGLDQLISASTMNGSGNSLSRFFLVGHCLWSWLFALLAAWFAGRVYARREFA